MSEEPTPIIHILLAFLLVATIIWNYILLAIAFFTFIVYLAYYTFSYQFAEAQEEAHRGGRT